MDITSVKRIHQSDWTDEGVRFLRARDIVATAKGEEPSDYLYISQEKYDEYSSISGKVAVDDLLVTGVGTIGVPYLVRNTDPLYFKDGNVIWFQNNNQINGEFFYYSFIGCHIQSFIHDSAGIGTVGTYTIDSGKKTPIYLPCTIEQRRIGAFMASVDNLITLHQCKYNHIQTSTITFNFNPFTSLNTATWEQRKFASVFDGLQNNTLSRADLNYESGTVKNVHYGDVLIKFGDYIDAAETELPYISDDAKADKFKNSFLQDGDIVIADTAEDDTVGKCTEIQDSEGLKLLSGLHTIACRPKEKYGPMFLGYYINSPAYHNQLKPLMQGIKVTSISKSALQDTDMIVPKSIEEQSKIGEYLSNLDHLITLHQCKYSQDYIDVFTNKNRSDPLCFTAAWEQRKVGDFLSESREIGHKGDVAHKITVKLWGKGVFRKDDAGSSNTQYFIRHANQFIYSKLDFLNCAFGVIPDELEGLETTTDLPTFDCEGIVPQFMFYIAIQPDFYLKNGMIADGSRKAKRIHAEVFMEMPLCVPAIEEQKKVVNCFEKLDNLITLHQRKFL